jgi:hypothetical protein
MGILNRISKLKINKNKIKQAYGAIPVTVIL